MQILFFAPYYTSKIDAASRKVDQLLEISLSLGYSVTLFSCSKRSSIHQNLTQIKLKSRPSRFAVFWRIYMAFRLGLLCIRKSVIISDFNPFIQIPSRSRLIHVIHHIDDYPSLGSSSFGFLGRFVTSWLPYLVKSIWRGYLHFSPSTVITVSNAVGLDIKQVAPSKSVTVIYNFLQFNSAYTASPRIDEAKQSFSIVMVGHNIARKNYPFAIEALATLSSLVGPQFSCTIVGNNVHLLKPQLDKYFLSDLFRLCTGVSEHDLSNIYSQANLFMSVSDHEGFCIPYVEAQYYSCSTLTPSLPVFRELAFGNNYFFRKGSTSFEVAEIAYNILAKASQDNQNELSHSKGLPQMLSKEAISQQFKSLLEFS